MYVLDAIETYNPSPWEIPFIERIKRMKEYFREGYRTIAYIYEKADSSTFRYRVYNMCQALEKSTTCRGAFFFEDELELLAVYLPYITFLCVVRVRWTWPLASFFLQAERAEKIIFFDVDDLVFDLSYLPLVTHTLNQKLDENVEYDFWFSYIGRIHLSASQADFFIGTNEFLCDKLYKKFNRPTFSIPNFLNREQVQASAHYRAQKINARSSRPFQIGYFSGTPTHANDFKCIYKELIALLDKYKDITLKIVGFMDIPQDMTYLVEKGQVVTTPLLDFVALQQSIAESDVNIVPLVENTFTNCKSELKFFEASIVGTISCMTPTSVYHTCIDNGVNGFLCRQGEWYQTIEALYLGKIDSKSILQHAHDDIMEKYYGTGILSTIEKIFEETLECQTTWVRMVTV